MRRDHAGVAGMELAVETLLFQPVPDGIDSLGNHEHRSGVLFGDEVTERASDRAGHADDLRLLVNQGKLPVNPPNLLGVPRRNPRQSLVGRHVQKQIAGRIDQVDETFDQLNRLHDDSRLTDEGISRIMQTNPRRGNGTDLRSGTLNCFAFSVSLW